MATVYRGRFAPSPTGPLHQGSLVAALASWLDAKAHFGHWLIRIEDIDYTRCKSEFTAVILSQLNTLGLQSDEPVCQQSHRNTLYQQALNTLIANAYAYPCGCSRKTIMDTHRGIYPGTCRQGLNGYDARAWRVFCGTRQKPVNINWYDRKLGLQYQDLTLEIGDFILRRADGPWAYQLAVVMDDADQAITHVVRGEDLADNTPRQIHLQNLLGLPQLAYLHTPLVLAEDGQKLSKQTGAKALDLSNPIACLNKAMHTLELPVPQTPHLHDWLRIATGYWAEKFRL